MRKIRKLFCRLFYEMIAKRMPLSNSKIRLGQKLLRYKCAKVLLKSVGKNVNIEKGAKLQSQISIGDNSGLGVNSDINGPVQIGKNVLMAPDVIIYTQNHSTNRIDLPIAEQGYDEIKPVIIDDDVWICRRVIILPGVHVHKGAVLAAGAVITKDVPEYAVVGGNPAKVLKIRS